MSIPPINPQIYYLAELNTNGLNPLDRTFINLQTDFGLKHLFVSPGHTNALKLPISTMFEGELRVTDIDFRNNKRSIES